GVQRRLLERGADRRPYLSALPDHVVAGNARPAAGGWQQRGEHQHGCRFSGAVGTEESVDLARGDGQIDSIDGPRSLAKLADELLNLDRRFVIHRSDSSK